MEAGNHSKFAGLDYYVLIIKYGASLLCNALMLVLIHGDYLVCRSVVAYRTTVMPIYNLAQVSNAGKIGAYDSIDEDVLRCYNEYALTSLIFFAMKEGACSEQSSRMTAMDSATKNAGNYLFVIHNVCYEQCVFFKERYL